MAKPARAKKKQAEEAPGKKGATKAASKTAAKSKSKAKEAKGPEAKGLRARVAKAAPAAKGAKAAKGGKAAPAREKRSATRFLREVRLEMSKVTWPSREELIQSTIVVLIAVTVAGLYIALFDEIFSRLISWIS